MITTVGSAAALSAALKTAGAGDTIELTAGTYAPIAIKGVHFAQDVTITAKAGAEVVLTGLKVQESNGLAFSNLEFKVDPAAPANPFQVAGSQDIHFIGLDVHGSVDGNYANDVGGMLIRDSSNVSVADSEFHDLMYGLSHLKVDGFSFTGNNIHHVQVDGLRGGGSSNVLVAANRFSDLHPDVDDHADAIQFWTSNTTVSAHDIVVRDNLFVRGDGAAPQGVFFRDQIGTLPFQGVTITGNVIIGASYNGIYVIGGDDVLIEDNYVQGFLDKKSRILVENVDGVTIQGNDANAFVHNSSVVGLLTADNRVLVQTADLGLEAVAAWMARHLGGGLQLIGDAGDNLLAGGAGADTLSGGAGSDTLSGGAGDDLYILSDRATLVENAGEGSDTVQASVTMTLPKNVENLVLAGTKALNGNGNTLDNQLTGNAGANQLKGAGGADTLAGGGGNDTLSGGTGSDVFRFAPGGGRDVVTDFAQGDSIDVRAYVTAGQAPVMVQAGADVTVSFTGGDVITIQGSQLSALHLTNGFIL